MDTNPETIEEKIMKDIECGKVKLRSRYIFLAEKLGVGSVVVLSLLLGALAFCLFLFYLRATDNLLYLSFGKVGIFAFLESFPYLLVIGFILLVFAAAMMLRLTDISYRKPFIYTGVVLVGIVIALGGILTYTNIAEVLEREGYGPGPQGRLIRPFLHNPFSNRKYGVVGMIVGFERDAILLETPDGIRNVVIPDAAICARLQFGQLIAVVGDLRGNTFVAQKYRIIDQARVPLIRRGILIRFPSSTEF